MLIIGCDFHSGFEPLLAIFDDQAGKVVEKSPLKPHPQFATGFSR